VKEVSRFREKNPGNSPYRSSITLRKSRDQGGKRIDRNWKGSPSKVSRNSERTTFLGMIVTGKTNLKNYKSTSKGRRFLRTRPLGNAKGGKEKLHGFSRIGENTCSKGDQRLIHLHWGPRGGGHQKSYGCQDIGRGGKLLSEWRRGENSISTTENQGD